MIAPRTRLLFWVAALVLPFALMAAVAPASATISLAFIGAFALMAVVDAVLGKQHLDGIGVELPPIVRMSKDRAAKSASWWDVTQTHWARRTWLRCSSVQSGRMD